MKDQERLIEVETQMLHPLEKWDQGVREVGNSDILGNSSFGKFDSSGFGKDGFGISLK